MGRNLKDFYTNNPNQYEPGMSDPQTDPMHWAKDSKGENIKGKVSPGVQLMGGLGEVKAHEVGGAGRDVSAKVTRNRDVKKTGTRLAKVAAGLEKPKKGDTFSQKVKKK